MKSLGALTQAFFARLLKKNDLERFDAEGVRYTRPFLLVALKDLLANERDKSQ